MKTFPLLLLLLLACKGSDDAPDSDTDADTDADTDSDTDTDTDTDADEPATDAALFSPSPHPALEIVIHARAGSGPAPGALDAVRDALDLMVSSGHIVKPGGITIRLGEELPAGDGGVATLAELDATLEAARGPFIVGDASVIHGLYTDGTYDNDGNGTVLGLAYGGARFVMLRDPIDDACNDPVLTLLGMGQEACDILEGTVMLHELGHLFGLVNNGVDMVSPHEDAGHVHHDASEDCLMYFAAETPAAAGAVASRLSSGSISVQPFDSQCLADMAAALP